MLAMARPLRIELSGALYHVTSRGDRREAIFEDDEDRDIFLSTLAEVVDGLNWVCHAYCLMTNHVLCVTLHIRRDCLSANRHLKPSRIS